MLQGVEQRHFLWGSAHLKQDVGDVKLRVHCGIVFWAKYLKFKRGGGERGDKQERYGGREGEMEEVEIGGRGRWKEGGEGEKAGEREGKERGR